MLFEPIIQQLFYKINYKSIDKIHLWFILKNRKGNQYNPPVAFVAEGFGEPWTRYSIANTLSVIKRGLIPRIFYFTERVRLCHGKIIKRRNRK